MEGETFFEVIVLLLSGESFNAQVPEGPNVFKTCLMILIC